ncbi:MAG: methyl-accepting chemotaxis protein, partial [Thalassolituus sp.]
MFLQQESELADYLAGLNAFRELDVVLEDDLEKLGQALAAREDDLDAGEDDGRSTAQHIRDVKLARDSWRSHIEDVILAVEEGNQDATQEHSPHIHEATEVLLKEVEALRVHVTDLSLQAVKGVIREIRQIEKILLLLLVVTITLSILFGGLIVKSVKRGLDRAKRLIGRIAGGDMVSPISPGNHDEIGALLADVESMRQQVAGMMSIIQTGATDVTEAVQIQARNASQVRSSVDVQTTEIQQ